MPSFDIVSSATNAVRSAATSVQTSAATALSSAAGSLDALRNSVTSGLAINISSITSSLPGAADIQNALQAAKNNINKLGNLFDNTLGTVSKTEIGAVPDEGFPNILHYYTSYNYVLTLSVLDDAALNFPDETYRKGMLGPLILKSGSGNPDDRIPTIYKTADNPSGKFDFFMENLTVSSIIGFEKSTGNSNASGLKFKIVEPYSMGLFFQVLQTAALSAGHPNYLDMPLLLTIEFKGHISADMQNVQVDKTTKYFPIRLRKFGMKVSGKGCEYDIDAYPVNEKAHSKVYSELKTDVSIVGKSVGEMLQTGEKSLQFVLNQRLQEAVKRKDVNVADQILISFPQDLKTGDGPAAANEDSSTGNSATVNPNSQGASFDLFKKLGVTTSSINKTQVQSQETLNDIGKSTMGFSLYNEADTPFAKDNLVYDDKNKVYKRGNITINPAVGEFKFAQGSDVINAINQVILMSEYGRTALSQINADGQIQWWRVETQLYYIPSDANLTKTGVKPKLIVYRVVPYLVSASYFLPPNAPNPGTEQSKKKAVKKYSYIYTGKNVDILNFDIEFNNGFYTSLYADGGKNSGDANLKENQNSGGEVATPPESASGSKPAENQVPTVVLKDATASGTGKKGGGGLDDSASIAARQFHDAITAGVDMINLNMTILGDPYYLGDSGMGNYSAKATSNSNINSDGAIDYQSGEVFVTVDFRSPIDIKMSDGLYQFPDTAINPQFSGLYKVNKAESTFARGKFTQQLKLLRIRGQEVKADSAKPTNLVSAPAKDENANAGRAPTDAEIAENNASLGDFPG